MRGQLHALAALSPGKESWYPLGRRDWVGPSATLDAVEKKNLFPLPEIETQFLGRPASISALFRLSYHGPLLFSS
jgi:hypothetical protein